MIERQNQRETSMIKVRAAPDPGFPPSATLGVGRGVQNEINKYPDIVKTVTELPHSGRNKTAHACPFPQPFISLIPNPSFQATRQENLRASTHTQMGLFSVQFEVAHSKYLGKASLQQLPDNAASLTTPSTIWELMLSFSLRLH